MKLFGRRAIPVVDRLQGDPAAHEFRAQLARGEWQPLHAHLEQLTDWDEREWLLRVLTEIDGRPAWLDAWVAAHPNSSIPYLFRGGHGVVWAWEARTGAWAENVEEEQWKLFFARLEQADGDLAHAAQLDPSDPTPFALSLPVARGLQLGFDELWQRFQGVISRNPWSLDAHMQMVQSLAPKWGGTHDQLMEFASTTVERAPTGHAVHATACSAALELAFDREGDYSVSEFYARPQVRTLLETAADKSVRSAAFQDRSYTWTARNYFAFTFGKLGESRSQHAEMEHIGEHVTEWPWQLFGDAAQVFDAQRRACRRAA